MGKYKENAFAIQSMNIYNYLREVDVNDWSEAVKRLCKPQEYALTGMAKSKIYKRKILLDNKNILSFFMNSQEIQTVEWSILVFVCC